MTFLPSAFARGACAATLLPLLALGTGLAAASAPEGSAVAEPALEAPRAGSAPPDDTIVLIQGDRANGFGIKHYDGSWDYPPTDSEAIAECGEYDRRAQRVRCRVGVRTWYRDLTAMKRTIGYYRAQLDDA